MTAETRKTVTILFADVVGSTALGERLDPESLRHVMARYFDVARGCLERHGGTVEKFIGDAVMAVFGVPTVHEDDALRAIRAAAELGNALTTLNETLQREYGVVLELRTGINTGEVVTGTDERLAAGDAVNVAARLEQAAAQGEILLGETTVRLARDAIRIEPVEPLSARGKADRVAAYRLIEVIAGASAFERRLNSPLVGRRRELAVLRAAFEESVARRRCEVVTVLGPPEIGKSRLARELEIELSGEATVFEGRCLPYGDGITFWPLVEIFRRAGAEDELTAALGGGAPEEIFWAVRKALERRARERPLALVIDDIHWAEPTLLDFIEHLGTWTRDAPIVVLALARPELIDIRPAWNGRRVDLEPLSAADAGMLIDGLLRDTDLADGSRLRVLETADGNPLFVEQLVASLAEGGHADAVPHTIQALLAARIDGLPGEEREVLERASVIGAAFDWDLLAGLSPAGRRPSGARLMSLVRKELIQLDEAKEDTFRFRHALIRDAAYERISKAARSELHERLADLLDARREDTLDEIVAYHLEQAYRAVVALGPSGERGRALADRAAGLLTDCGQRARSRGDLRAAAKLIDRAVELLAAGDLRRPATMAALGRVLVEGGDLGRADIVLEGALEAARSAGQIAIAADTAVALASLRLQTTTDPSAGQQPAWTAIDEALPVLEAAGDPAAMARVRAHAGALRFWGGDAAGAIHDQEESARHAREAGDRPQELNALGSILVAAVMGPTPVDEALARVHAIRTQAAETERTLEQSVLSTWAHLEAMRGEFRVALELTERSRALSDDLRFGTALARHAFGAGPVFMLVDQPGEAEAALRVAYDELDRIGLVGQLVSIGPLLAEAVLAQGRLDEALELTRRASELAVPEDVDAQSAWRRARAVALARTGDLDAALRLADEGVEAIARTDYLDDQARALAARGEVFLLAGRRRDAGSDFDAAIGIATTKGNVAYVRQLVRLRAVRA